MKQNLPIDYPEMLVRFMTAQTQEEFGDVTYNDINYRLDSLNDEHTVIRITNTDTGVICNITEYDYTEHYANMPEIAELLMYIEDQIVFTSLDWVNHYTKKYPVYAGTTVDVYRDPGNNNIYIKQKISQPNGFWIGDSQEPLFCNGFYYVPVDDGDVRSVTMLTYSTSDAAIGINNTPEQVESWIKCVLSNENLLNYVDARSWKNTHQIEKIDSRIYQIPSNVNWCGLDITIDSDNKTFSVIHDGNVFKVYADGTWSKKKYEEPKPRAGIGFGSTYIYNTYVSPDDVAFVTAINDMLTNLVKELGHVIEEQGEDNV